MPDISLTAAIDPSGVAEGTKTMDRDVKAFVSSAKAEMRKLEVDMKKSLQSVQSDRFAGGAGARFANQVAGGGAAAAGRSKVGYLAAGVSYQAQDIAVQLQSGTKAATVIAQQGSQLLSLFGPQGAILGGVLAIGAGIYSWATGMKAADEQAKQNEATLERMQKLAKETRATAVTDTQEGHLAMIERIDGKQAAAETKAAQERATALKKIEEDAAQGRLSIAEKENAINSANYKFDEQAKLRAKQQDDEAVKERKQQLEEQVGLEKKLRDQRDELSGASPAQKIRELNVEYKELAKQQKSLTGNEYLKKEIEMRQVAIELQKEGKKIAADDIKDRKDKANELAKAFESAASAARSVSSAIHDIAKDFKKAVEKDLVEAAANAMAQTLSKGQATLNHAADLLDPGAAKAKREKDRREKLAIREAAERETDKQDRDLRKGGGRGLNPEERARATQERIRRADLQKNRQDTSIISQESIDKLAKQIAQEMNAALAK